MENDCEGFLSILKGNWDGKSGFRNKMWCVAKFCIPNTILLIPDVCPEMAEWLSEYVITSFMISPDRIMSDHE